MRCACQEFSIYEYYTKYGYEKFINFVSQKDDKYKDIEKRPIPLFNGSHQIDWIYSLFEMTDFKEDEKITPKKFLVIIDEELDENSKYITLNGEKIIEFISIPKEDFEKAIKEFFKVKK